jgi:hypothetical protein
VGCETKSGRPWTALAGWVLAMLLVPRPGVAGDVVVESHLQTRSPDAVAILAPVLDELASRGYPSGDRVARAFETAGSAPARPQPGLPHDFIDRVDEAHKAFITGKFDVAVRALALLVDQAHASPGSFALNEPMRDRYQKALTVLAIARHRLGDPAARETFAEMLRSIPNASVSRGAYGPDAVAAFEAAARELEGQGRGRLVVQVSERGTRLYLNERFVAEDRFAKRDLIPGEYRVLVQSNKALTRVHRVRIEAGREATLEIDAELDRVVRTESTWAGFVFDSAVHRDQLETAYAARFGRQLKADSVAIVGIDRSRGRRVVVGAHVDVRTGRETRRATVALDPAPPTERLRALARFITGDEASDGLEIERVEVTPLAPASAPAPEKLATAPRARWAGWMYLTGGLAVSSAATGGYLAYLHGSCRVPPVSPGLPCRDFRNTQSAAGGAIVASIALAAATAYLVVRRPARSARVAVGAAPSRGGGVIGLTVAF